MLTLLLAYSQVGLYVTDLIVFARIFRLDCISRLAFADVFMISSGGFLKWDLSVLPSFVSFVS